MKVLLPFLAVLLASCATAPLTPATVSAPVTDATNALKCLILAQNGVCDAPCPLPASSTVACAYLPDATATVNDNVNSIGPCALSAAATPVAAAVAGIQTTLCVKAGKTVGGGTTPVPAAPVVTAPAH